MWLLVLKGVFFIVAGALLIYSWRLTRRGFVAHKTPDVAYRRLVLERQNMHFHCDDVIESDMHQRWLKQVREIKPEKSRLKPVK